MNWRAPKSVRQIGNTKGKIKIYVEDYVMSFARKISRQQGENEVGGVLLGHRFFHAGEKVFLISGMVMIRNFHKRMADAFSQEMWTDIYTDIKENFTNLDVVGWYYEGGSRSDKIPDALLEIHRRNFSEEDRLLYVRRESEGEDSFYSYENGGFHRREGFYIYYEKNPEMRRYMMEEENRFVHIVEQEDDRVLRNIRGVLKENEERQREKNMGSKKNMGLAGLVLTLGLILGMTALYHGTGLDELKQQVKGIQSELKEKKDSGTTVETLSGGVVTPDAVTAAAAEAVVSGTAAGGGEQQPQ